MSNEAQQFLSEFSASAQVPAKTLAAELSVSQVSIWRMSKDGRLPKPRKFGPNTTRFNVGEVREALAKLVAEAA